MSFAPLDELAVAEPDWLQDSVELIDGPSALWDLSFHSFHPTDLSAVQRPPSPLDSLEREFCTNFTCCGLNLPDMHHLLEHFEDTHVVFPEDISDGLSPPPHPYVLSYPRPHTPTSSTTSTSTTPTPTTTRPTTPLADPLLARAHITPSPSPSPVLALPPAFFGLAPASGPARTDRSKSGRFKTLHAPVHAPARARARADGQLSASGRKRDRQYRCPRPGCTKSYLNPNGLKYHVEKGTCEIAPKGGWIDRDLHVAPASTSA